MTKDELVNAIAELTVLELSELVKAIEEKFGVKAAAPAVAVAAAAAPAGCDTGDFIADRADQSDGFLIIITRAGHILLPYDYRIKGRFVGGPFCIQNQIFRKRAVKCILIAVRAGFIRIPAVKGVSCPCRV